jgi:hypothetical protein
MTARSAPELAEWLSLRRREWLFGFGQVIHITISETERDLIVRALLAYGEQARGAKE